ncbi:MAG: 4-hydroxy-3-methylbut-2-enyl diphosphate reductase [Firmicutes bacterium]|nr:4-hydroxy-3-methylbut-2-enyl diphosphate reductase [Bacillota bacterium]
MQFKITTAEHAGFCFGVKNAIKLAEQALESLAQGKYEIVFCLGKLIHNETVTDRLEKRGIVVVNTVEEILNKVQATGYCFHNNIAVVIRSHGVTKHIHDTLIKHNFTIIDATCPFVKKIHNIVHSHYIKHINNYNQSNSNNKVNSNVIILGNKNHPEVIGINGWCDNRAIIIESEEDIKQILVDSLSIQHYICVVQTTFNSEAYKKLSKIISKKSNKTVEFFDTICYTTLGRQKEVQNLAKKCDCVLVIGSKNSSNTIKLFDISQAINKCTYLVSHLDCLNAIQLNKEDHIAIVAGASTPIELCSEVKQKINGSPI